MSTTMVADAVALTESGVLVNGLCVTDLLSGLEVRGEDIEDTADTGDASPVFRGSGVPLRRLESVRELVEEVLEARAVDPELTSANPVVPRTVFPWGIGAQVSDVLVVGPDKEATAAYLRISGLRARTVDVARPCAWPVTWRRRAPNSRTPPRRSRNRCRTSRGVGGSCCRRWGRPQWPP
ncbi:hypothetical protein [Corynebacterium sp. AOP12-C2-36]|uniref:hypothetical protein n=1 Tax=Corynebacterium sp. AOP12-C2-36 TaxID=3457723 RepID=UPI00403353E9